MRIVNNQSNTMVSDYALSSAFSRSNGERKLFSATFGEPGEPDSLELTLTAADFLTAKKIAREYAARFLQSPLVYVYLISTAPKRSSLRK